MNKREYMDILIDYLSTGVSDDEKYEILRDVEEIIEDGKLSGKAEEEVISKLGSPKALVKNIKGEDFDIVTETIINKEELGKRVQVLKDNSSNFFSRTGKSIINIKNNLFSKIKFNVNSVKSKEKVNNGVSKKRIKKSNSIFMRILKFFSSFIGLLIIFPMQLSVLLFIISALLLIGSIVTLMIIFSGVNTSILFVGLFGIIFIIGFMFILFDLFKWFGGLLKTLCQIIKGIFV